MKISIKKIIIPIIIIAIITGLALTLYFYLHSATLIIQVAPTEANITIGNKNYKNGIYKTAPKTTSVTISAEGFKDKTIDLSLEKGKVSTINTFLEPISENWSYFELQDNIDSLNILFSSNGYSPWNLSPETIDNTLKTDSSLGNFFKKLSINNITPIDFSICTAPANRQNCDSITIDYDYSSECNDALCLIISGRRSELIKETTDKVRTKLKENGYNLDDYQYTYQQINY